MKIVILRGNVKIQEGNLDFWGNNLVTANLNLPATFMIPELAYYKNILILNYINTRISSTSTTISTMMSKKLKRELDSFTSARMLTIPLRPTSKILDKSHTSYLRLTTSERSSSCRLRNNLS